MDHLTAVLQKELEAYTGEAYNGYAYLTASSDYTHFVVTAVGKVRDQRIINTSLVVQRLGDLIVIDQDTNSDPLYEALLQAGVPREQIILAYAGEPVPETA
jgi:XisI protein